MTIKPIASARDSLAAPAGSGSVRVGIGESGCGVRV